MRVAWQVMTREPAQAGNRASRTEHYLQWWESSPEWNTETSAAEKAAQLQLIFLSLICRLRGASLERQLPEMQEARHAVNQFSDLFEGLLW